LITCRNLLIYLQRDAQRHLMSLFHYALEEDGYLLVGTAEGVESDLFVCEDKKLGLYRRRSVPTPKGKPSTFPLTSHRHPSEDPPASRAEQPASYGVLHEQMVERYAPPSALINPDGELVHYSARAGRYLRLSGGKPTHDFYQLLPEPLRRELRAAIHMARGQDGGYRSGPIGLTLEGQPSQVILRVQPIDQPRMDGFVLVIFDELEDTQGAAPNGESGHTDANVRALEAELEQSKKRMQTLIEEHENIQERAQAYNEELESSNEELRSTMEELETSKEEMQSMNEELTTLNQEVRQKVEELDQLSSDLHNLLTATEIATVFLDRDMRIMRFTPSMAELLDLRESDRGRSFTDLTHRLNYGQLREDFQRVLDKLAPIESEVRSEQDRWYLARLQPYRNVDDRIEGVVVTFIDVTERKKAEEQVREAKDLAEKIIDTVRSPMLVLDDDLRVRSANEAFRDYFAVALADIKGTLVYELNGGQWDIPLLRELLEDILPKDHTMENFELEHQFEPRGRRSLILNARRIDHIQLILLAVEDVTERKQARQTLERSRDELEQKVARRTAEIQQQAARLQLLVLELASAEQRERKRMASVLHDDLQQLLVGLKLQLGMTRNQHQDESAAGSLEEAIRTLDQAIDTTRTLVRQVAPQMLYDEGLIPALRWLGEEMARQHGLHVQIQAGQAEPAIGDEIKTLLFESIREMLFNVVKHAEVDQATVAVRQEDDHLIVTVSDEGVGFDVQAKASQDDRSHFGVFSWCNRIEAMGGRCSIDATPGAGTRIDVNLPVGIPHADESAGRLETPVASTLPRPGLLKTKAGGIRVLVVDDHTLVRKGIVTILNLDERVTVVGEAGDGVEAIAIAQQYQPDVVLMDVNMPRMNGIKATREIGRRWPGMIVVGLSMQSKEDGPARAMSEAGAAAFLSKSDDSEQMIETILRLTQAQSREKRHSAK
jgi:two-component system CheB/CheR fusion protein